MVKTTNPRPSGRLSKGSTGIFTKTTMDSPCLTQGISRSARHFKEETKAAEIHRQGNRPNAADPLSDVDIDHETFYSRNVIGIHSPRALLNSLWMNNCIFFGMRPGKERRDFAGVICS